MLNVLCWVRDMHNHENLKGEDKYIYTGAIIKIIFSIKTFLSDKDAHTMLFFLLFYFLQMTSEANGSMLNAFPHLCNHPNSHKQQVQHC